MKVAAAIAAKLASKRDPQPSDRGYWGYHQPVTAAPGCPRNAPSPCNDGLDNGFCSRMELAAAFGRLENPEPRPHTRASIAPQPAEPAPHHRERFYSCYDSAEMLAIVAAAAERADRPDEFETAAAAAATAGPNESKVTRRQHRERFYSCYDSADSIAMAAAMAAAVSVSSGVEAEEDCSNGRESEMTTPMYATPMATPSNTAAGDELADSEGDEDLGDKLRRLMHRYGV